MRPPADNVRPVGCSVKPLLSTKERQDCLADRQTEGGTRKGNKDSRHVRTNQRSIHTSYKYVSSTDPADGCRCVCWLYCARRMGLLPFRQWRRPFDPVPMFRPLCLILAVRSSDVGLRGGRPGLSLSHLLPCFGSRQSVRSVCSTTAAGLGSVVHIDLAACMYLSVWFWFRRKLA